VYLLRGEPAQDSARMRHRIGALIYEFDTLKDQLAGAVNRELGIPAPYPTYWPDFLKDCQLRDVLDIVTIGCHLLSSRFLVQDRSRWLAAIQRIFEEENVHYSLDDQGGSPVTKEHMWANWLKPYLPRAMLNYESYSEMIYPTHSEIKITKKAGDPQSGRIRCVCAPCNNGWMSVRQSETKPILIPLLRGESFSLHRRAQTTLAAWIAMFTMVAEFLDQTGTRIEVLPADRIWLKENQTVPKNWKIWLANYERGSWKGLWIHSTVPIQGEEHIPETNQLGIDLPNTQSTTFLVGKLYVHVISSAISRIIRKQDIVGQGRLLFPRLWPIRRSPLAWPPFRPITDEEAESIASALIRRARKTPPAVRSS